jgi:hypothetical protein
MQIIPMPHPPRIIGSDTSSNGILPRSSPLTSADRLAEDIFVVPIVVSELELRNIQREVFGADLVERAHHAALKYRPEAFNRVGVDRAYNILALAMIDDPCG